MAQCIVRECVARAVCPDRLPLSKKGITALAAIPFSSDFICSATKCCISAYGSSSERRTFPAGTNWAFSGGASGATGAACSGAGTSAGTQPSPQPFPQPSPHPGPSHFHSHTQRSPHLMEDFFGVLMQRAFGHRPMPSRLRSPPNRPRRSLQAPSPQLSPQPGAQSVPQLAPSAQSPVPQQVPQTPAQGSGSHGKRVGGMQIVLYSMLKQVFLMSTRLGTGLQQEFPQTSPVRQQSPWATQPSGVQPVGPQPSGVQPDGLLPSPAVAEAAVRPIMARVARYLIRIAPSVRVRDMSKGARPVRAGLAPTEKQSTAT